MIPRIQYTSIKEKIFSNRLLILSGPREVGKKEMVRQILKDANQSFLELNAAKKSIQKQFDEVNENSLAETFGNHRFVILQEAQYIDKLQQIIEELLSGNWNLTLILTCSYEPVLDELLKEVLQLQGLEISIMPPTFYELAQHNGLPVEEGLLEQRLIYGNYPAVVSDLEFAELKLRELIDQVIFTNLGVTDRINKGEKLMRMLQVLAFEVGDAISYNEVGERCGLDNETVERYIDLLEKSFVLIKLPTYFNNHRYELKKSHAVYFVDNGIRNVLINNFNPMFMRNDWDQLWKNWIISEKIKWNRLNNKDVKTFFWKTHTKQIMDYIEVFEGKVSAYKTSWEKRKKLKIPVSFIEAYPFATTHGLNRSTYWGFLTKK
ncbi:MAG: ATP-binding protein [Flavobacteriia bacterium]|nr:ATP-binding protein [Flavobacteriia bacterium]